MKIFKQPWFLIFVFVISVYTYKFYSDPQLIRFSFNQAQAGPKASTEKEEKQQTIKDVDLSQLFSAKKVQSFHLSTHKDIQVRFETSHAREIVVGLKGPGVDFKNDGEKLSDWFKIANKRGRLEIRSYSKKSSGNMSWKGLAKSLSGGRSSKAGLVLTIQYPSGHVFKNMNLEIVSADVQAQDLFFKSFEITTVSGDLSMKKSQGEKLEIESVSSDSDIEVTGLKKVSFTSVSGDMTLAAKESQPKMTFESVSGDLNLNMSKNTKLDIQFESISGELENEFGLSQKALSHLQFNSVSGDATIKKF